MNSQPAGATNQGNNALKNVKPIQFAMLFPVIKPLLDKDRAMQLTVLYDKLKERKISKDVFVNHMRGLVGDHVLKLAVAKLQEQASRSSQVATHQVASHAQFLVQQQHMNSSPQSHKQQPQNMQVKLQAKVDKLTKEKIDLGNRLKLALSEVESVLAQKSSWDKERTSLSDELKSWIARAVKAESSNSELTSKLQTCEAILKAKVEELQSVHNTELKKLQMELEEVRPDSVKGMGEAFPSLQDGYSTCADKFVTFGIDSNRKLFEEYCAELDWSLFIDAP